LEYHKDQQVQQVHKALKDYKAQLAQQVLQAL
jgi:hypothetical protein